MAERFEFSSSLAVPPEEAWRWITSMNGITAEIMPYIRMGVPEGLLTLSDIEFVPGQRLFRSVIYLFGFLPVDFTDLTLLELTPGVGFVEQSPMGTMKQWRHERRIAPTASGCTITDVLVFEPRFASAVFAWFVRRLFTHRHAVLRDRFGRA